MVCLSVGFCLSACAEVGLNKGCQPCRVPPCWVWDGTGKPGYSPGPWPWRGLRWHQKKRNREKKGWAAVEKGGCLPPSSFALANVTVRLCGDKQRAVPAQEPPCPDHPWDICCPPLPTIFTPGLDTFPLFPGLMEVPEKLFTPFAPEDGAKIHLCEQNKFKIITKKLQAKL